MSIVRFALAALVLGASQAPAFAVVVGSRTGDNPGQTRIVQPVEVPAMTEGRQAAMIATGSATAEAFVTGRNTDDSHSR